MHYVGAFAPDQAAQGSGQSRIGEGRSGLSIAIREDTRQRLNARTNAVYSNGSVEVESPALRVRQRGHGDPMAPSGQGMCQRPDLNLLAADDGLVPLSQEHYAHRRTRR
jgi:hypothetical protein